MYRFSKIQFLLDLEPLPLEAFLQAEGGCQGGGQGGGQEDQQEMHLHRSGQDTALFREEFLQKLQGFVLIGVYFAIIALVEGIIEYLLLVWPNLLG